MRILCINGIFLNSLDELKNLLENTTELGLVSTNEVLAAVRDGAVTEWLRKGSDIEREMAIELCQKELTHDKIKDHALLNMVKTIICKKVVEPIDIADFGIIVTDVLYVGTDGKKKPIIGDRILDYGTGKAKLFVSLKSRKAINVDVEIVLIVNSEEGKIHRELSERMDMSESDEKAFLLSFSIDIVKGYEYKLALIASQYTLASFSLVNKQLLNGHDYVDLGLPSGTMWATCNIGATKPEESGKYYAWGETNNKANFDIDSYIVPQQNDLTLKKNNDVASVEWGKKWRMPTRDEFLEIKDNCDWAWCIYNGVPGYKVSSKNKSTSIFLPSVGVSFKNQIVMNKEWGAYWSSNSSEINGNAVSLFFRKDNLSVNDYEASYGLSVRAVFNS